MERLNGNWSATFGMGGSTIAFTCGYCGHTVASNHGTDSQAGTAYGPMSFGYVRICPNCNRATFIVEHPWEQAPEPLAGRDVGELPDDVSSLYWELRAALSTHAYTASVLTARKLLMHIAVSKGAPTRDTFVSYVRFLVSEGYVPPGGDNWLKYIVKRSNEENHEINIATRQDALALLTLTEHLLRSVYELSTLIPSD